MGGTPRKQTKPGPSYEDGRLRDRSIEEKMDPEVGEADLLRLIKKAVTHDSWRSQNRQGRQ